VRNAGSEKSAVIVIVLQFRDVAQFGSVVWEDHLTIDKPFLSVLHDKITVILIRGIAQSAESA
jgi:hypothetical protein